MNLFYVFDEYTDVADAKGANHIRNIIMDALRDPQQPRPEGELLIGEMTRECVLLILVFCFYPEKFSLYSFSFWLRATDFVPHGSSCLTHFVEEWDAYTAAVVWEADDRTRRIYRTFEEYLQIRRLSSGCLPSFTLCEFGLDLPEDVMHHPLLAELRQQATDLIAIGNVRPNLVILKEKFH